jgi:hypothetical protein
MQSPGSAGGGQPLNPAAALAIKDYRQTRRIGAELARAIREHVRPPNIPDDIREKGVAANAKGDRLVKELTEGTGDQREHFAAMRDVQRELHDTYTAVGRLAFPNSWESKSERPAKSIEETTADVLESIRRAADRQKLEEEFGAGLDAPGELEQELADLLDDEEPS